MKRRMHGDDGVAALEMGILLTLLMLLAFGTLPVYAMMRGYQRVSKSTTATLRYATAVSSNGTRPEGGTLSRRPSYNDILRFAKDAANDATLGVVVAVCKGAAPCDEIRAGDPDAAAPIPAVAGDEVRLTITETVDLSVLGRIANAASRLSGDGPRFVENNATITSTASAREE